MAKPHPFFLLLYFFLLVRFSSASSSFNPALGKAYEQMLKLQVDNGRAMLRSEFQKDAGNAAALITANYADFLELSVQQDPERYEQLLRAQEQRLEVIESRKNRNAWDDYAAAEVRMQMAISKLLFGNRLSAA